MTTNEPSLTVAIAQDVFVPGDIEQNLATIQRHVTQAADSGVDLLVLPELATSGYFTDPEIVDLAEPIDGPCVRAVQAMAERAGIAVCFGYPELPTPEGHVFNSAALIAADGSILANHRKTHLWADEVKRFTPADQAVTIAELGGLKVGVLICYEVEFPELVRNLALAGVDLVIVPTAVADFGTSDAFTKQIVGARATENNVFIAYANHAGLIDGMVSIGGSLIAAPLCRTLAAADAGPAFHVATLERAQLVDARSRLPYLADRRPELYG